MKCIKITYYVIYSLLSLEQLTVINKSSLIS